MKHAAIQWPITILSRHITAAEQRDQLYTVYQMRQIRSFEPIVDKPASFDGNYEPLQTHSYTLWPNRVKKEIQNAKE